MTSPVNRRDFLAAAGATVASASLGSLALASGPSRPVGSPEAKQPVGSPEAKQPAGAPEAKPTAPRLHKAVKLSMVSGDAPLADKFKMLKEAGFEGIDIDRHVDHDEVRRAKDASGLVVHGVVGHDHWDKPLSDPNPDVRKAGRESFIGTLHDCKAYGGTTALLVPGRVLKQVPYADAYHRSQDEVRKLVPVAEELQIFICIENVWNDMLFSPLEMARYIDEMNSPWVGSYFDVGNCVRYGWPEHWITALGKRIKKIDIKEFSRRLMEGKDPGAGFSLKIGDPGGDCDWPSVMAALDSIGYHGWASAEVPGGGAEEFKDISQRMDRAFASRTVAARS